jgi:hypothetical protein
MEASPQREPTPRSARRAAGRPRAVEPRRATIERPEGPGEIANAPWPSALDFRT